MELASWRSATPWAIFNSSASRVGVREHPVTHLIRWHAGTDYAAPIGTPVRAAGDGVVTKWTRSWTGGKLLVIKHDDGYETKYMHLDDKMPNIAEGVRVHEGQQIAFVGKTGRVTGPHLHFEVRDRWYTPLDSVALTHAGQLDSNFRFPPDIPMLSEPGVRGSANLFFKVRDHEGRIIGFATQATLMTVDDANKLAKWEWESNWSVTLTGRGSLFLNELEQPKPMFDAFAPVMKATASDMEKSFDLMVQRRLPRRWM